MNNELKIKIDLFKYMIKQLSGKMVDANELFFALVKKQGDNSIITVVRKISDGVYEDFLSKSGTIYYEKKSDKLNSSLQQNIAFLIEPLLSYLDKPIIGSSKIAVTKKYVQDIFSFWKKNNLACNSK